jgi:hypothetical protein
MTTAAKAVVEGVGTSGSSGRVRRRGDPGYSTEKLCSSTGVVPSKLIWYKPVVPLPYDEITMV